MPLELGWGVSPDREKEFQSILEKVPIGEPIIATKCKVDGNNGFLVAGENGWAWIGKASFLKIITSDFWSLGQKKWVRWHDIVDIAYSGDGNAFVKAIKRENDGTIKRGKNNKPKTKDLILKPDRNKDEPKNKWNERKKKFGPVFAMIFYKRRTQTPPAETDSKY